MKNIMLFIIGIFIFIPNIVATNNYIKLIKLNNEEINLIDDCTLLKYNTDKEIEDIQIELNDMDLNVEKDEIIIEGDNKIINFRILDHDNILKECTITISPKKLEFDTISILGMLSVIVIMAGILFIKIK